MNSCRQKMKVVYTTSEIQMRDNMRQIKIELANALTEIEQQQEWIEELQLENALQAKEIAVLKANPRTIVNNNHVNIKVDKFVVKQHAKENFAPLTDGLLRECLSITVDPRLLLGGPEAVAQLILETSLSGQNKVACTDTSRVVVFWKDVDSSIVTDLKMRKLMPRLVRPIYQPYYEAWRSNTSIDADQYRAIGDVLHRLHMISLKKDTTSKFYNTLASIITHAKCDLSFILEDDECVRDEDGNIIEYMTSDSD